ncbi:MAG: hydroxyethylthiazole kinase [Chloroflexota bacterium]
MTLSEFAAAILEHVRHEQPLVHHITNLVTMNDVANATLAVGARPVMALALNEVTQMVESARALVLNLGTPTPERVEVMLAAGAVANARGIPIVLDPVGVGATAFRSQSAQRLLTVLRLAVVRGNAGEIAALADLTGTVSGVDTARQDLDRAAVAQALARRHRTVVALTGATDLVSDGVRVAAVDNGHPLLKAVTGTGCQVSAITGAFCAVETDMLRAAVSALTVFGIAAERAAREAKGPGSFRIALFDALYALTAEEITQAARVRWLS